MSDKSPVIVIASGGHAKVVVSTLQRAGLEVSCVLDDREERWGKTLLDVPIRGPITTIQDMPDVRGIIAIGMNATWKRLSESN